MCVDETFYGNHFASCCYCFMPTQGDNRGWDGWMASPTQWAWVGVTSGSWWWTGRPGALRFMGLQRVGHKWVTELNWTRGEKLDELTTKERPKSWQSIATLQALQIFKELMKQKVFPGTEIRQSFLIHFARLHWDHTRRKTMEQLH